MMPVAEEHETEAFDTPDYKQKYKSLKRKLKFLIYEQECFQEELRKTQRKLLKVSRDKSFLLDRLVQYEEINDSSSDSDETLSSSSENEMKDSGFQKGKKKKTGAHTSMPSLPYNLDGFLGGYSALMSAQHNPHSSLDAGTFSLPQFTSETTFSDIPPKKTKKSRLKTASSKQSKSSEGHSTIPAEQSNLDIKVEEETTGGDVYEGDDNLIIDIPE
ncbi:uncharacterized protein LOC100375506 [Saccoglossus kowalevskii]|uniref:INO80 complex subunit E-like n=1 Tax=Saccoglossus kowalevskii TaxID=10224 RepID=A0ABM0GJP0_SACKO|nr:PREDICTED: INO80 complex subunit E-like [Saccoglossus kowalevskii]